MSLDRASWLILCERAQGSTPGTNGLTRNILMDCFLQVKLDLHEQYYYARNDEFKCYQLGRLGESQSPESI